MSTSKAKGGLGQTAVRSLVFAKHVLYLIWEFTESNFCTFVLPNTAFGVLGAFSGPSLTQGHVSSIAEILQRLPLVVLFNWSNVFIFDLANQRSPESIKEDLANKPWRPLPTGKVTAEQTRKGMLVVIPAVLFFNYCLGVWRESALILLLTWLYNDLRGGDEIIRDLIIAVAFGLYNGGSLSIAIGPESDITHQGYIWIGLVSGIVLTTMQVQDLKDQTGDRGRGRKTIPLVLGENVSRWMIGLFVPIWSCCCAFFWGLRGWGYALPMVLGLYITFRVVRKCAPEEDSRTWKLWCLWTAVVYFLPVSHRLQTTMEIPQVSVGQVFTLGLGAVGGLLTHYGVFIHGEWHTQAPNILLFHAFFFMSLFIERHVCKELGYEWLSDASISIFTSYLASLVTSIVLYRLFFHRLTRASFPGPFYARVTKLWHVWQCRHSRNHLVLEDLRRQYGDFVRTGPSEITIFHPEVFSVVDGPKSECIKSEWYDILHPSLALVTARVKSTHRTRRQQWNRGFSTAAISQYEEKILKYLDQLDSCIEADAKAGRISEISDLFYWFGFDTMGDFVFNKSFDMLRNQQWHHIIIRLQRALSLLGPLSPAPWLVQVGFKLIPPVGVLKDWFDMVSWCEKQMRERISQDGDKSRVPDVAQYLMEDARSNKLQEDSWFWLKGDSLLAIVAGSEPTASALVAVFCELARYPHHAETIHQEVKNIDVRDIKLVAELPHLNGVINEALRLYPALLTGGARKTTENGATIGGTFIPQNTTIVAPRYSISRREDCFIQGWKFIPERWYSQPDMIRNKAAYTPFGTGHHSCLGRVLATDTIRFVTARLVKKYHTSYAPEETGERVARDLRDQFTSNPGRLQLVFKLREE